MKGKWLIPLIVLLLLIASGLTCEGTAPAVEEPQEEQSAGEEPPPETTSEPSPGLCGAPAIVIPAVVAGLVAFQPGRKNRRAGEFARRGRM